MAEKRCGHGSLSRKMSFSSSHGSVKSKSGEVECYCRVKAHVCVSNTEKNLRRLFYDCGKYKEKPSASKFSLTTLIAATLASKTPWKMASEAVVLRGTMRAHIDMVTTIVVPIDNSNMIVTSSRDKSLTKDEKTFDVARRRLTGHSHFVQDVSLSSDSQFVLYGS
ncbi:hypothetical protein V6N12_066034 [Hibiscus sabdariffa]|uniref:Uncharacterized protein n=1 Tax=Hibiscus sabdariffa TaxID=183260 RepID=A0ABR2AUF7_9ROSI